MDIGVESAENADFSGSDTKHSTSGAELKRSKDHTLLSPQPSDDPEDPLVSSSPSRPV